jgi:hypothetical protein
MTKSRVTTDRLGIELFALEANQRVRFFKSVHFFKSK